jgi:hypothetical protein
MLVNGLAIAPMVELVGTSAHVYGFGPSAVDGGITRCSFGVLLCFGRCTVYNIIDIFHGDGKGNEHVGITYNMAVTVSPAGISSCKSSVCHLSSPR